MSYKINTDDLPMERSLGIVWKTEMDTFDFDVQLADKPFTRRGVLSVVNNIFDPLGFIAPITVKGKMLFREFMSDGLN
ncbi:hypothetical protein SNE40_013134 [Patella caerulea]|uniref:Uncharacterized protein n=1 Tax=Patella caerulea TaxID=87958 RepID=A0AAN8PWK4_PATCE